jgi:hypothetical protein
MAAIILNQASKNGQGQGSGITGTFSTLKEGIVTLTSCTLGDSTTVAATFPGYVDSTSATNMRIPASHIVSIV